MLCFLGSSHPWSNHVCSLCCTSFYGCELWGLACDQVLDFCITWRKGVRRVWDLPYMTHCYLLPLLGLPSRRCLRWTKYVKGQWTLLVRVCLTRLVLLSTWLTTVLDSDLIFHLVDVMFCSAHAGMVFMLPTFLKTVLDLYQILYIPVQGLRLQVFTLKLSSD